MFARPCGRNLGLRLEATVVAVARGTVGESSTCRRLLGAGSRGSVRESSSRHHLRKVTVNGRGHKEPGDSMVCWQHAGRPDSGLGRKRAEHLSCRETGRDMCEATTQWLQLFEPHERRSHETRRAHPARRKPSRTRESRGWKVPGEVNPGVPDSQDQVAGGARNLVRGCSGSHPTSVGDQPSACRWSAAGQRCCRDRDSCIALIAELWGAAEGQGRCHALGCGQAPDGRPRSPKVTLHKGHGGRIEPERSYVRSWKRRRSGEARERQLALEANKAMTRIL